MKSILLAVIAVLVVLVVTTFPIWPYSRRWGYSPSVGIAAIALLLAALIHFDVI